MFRFRIIYNTVITESSSHNMNKLLRTIIKIKNCSRFLLLLLLLLFCFERFTLKPKYCDTLEVVACVVEL